MFRFVLILMLVLTSFILVEAKEDYVNVIVKQKLPSFEYQRAEISENIIAKNIAQQTNDKQILNISREEFETLKKDPTLLVQENREYRKFLRQSTSVIGAKDIWEKQVKDLNINGSTQTVCVIDSGVYYEHPDLGGCVGPECKILYSYDFIEETQAIDYPDLHGTHVAGIVGASGTTNGTAPGVRMVVLDVFSGFPTTSSAHIISAVNWCVDNSEAYNISVITMSLGAFQVTSYCDSSSQLEAQAVNNAIAKNITVIAATGNTNDDYPNPEAGIAYPACIENVTRVSASSKTDEITSYGFRHQNFPDIIMAPGGTAQGNCIPSGSSNGICSTDELGGYFSISGTSMAAPHVAGGIALVKDYLTIGDFPQITPQEITNLILNTGLQIYDDLTGINYSRINLTAMFEELEPLPGLDLNLSTNFLEEQENITISWNETNGVTNYDFNLTIIYNDTEILYFNDTSFGEINFSFEDLLPNTNYSVVFSANNSENNFSINESFSTGRYTPLFEFFLNQNSENISLFEPSSIIIFYNLTFGENLSFFVNGMHNITNSTFNETFEIEEIGVYNFTVIHNETNNFSEISKSLFVTLFDTSINITNISFEGVSDFFRNESLNFSLIANSDVGNITYNWSLNNDYVSNSSYFLFNASEYEIGEFNITSFISTEYANTSYMWLFNLTPIPPNIFNYTPEEFVLEEKKDDNITFFANAFEVFDRELNYTWFLNGENVTNNQSFVFVTEEFDNFSVQNISVLVQSNESNSSLNWNVTVLPFNIPVIFNESNNISNISFEINVGFLINLSEYFFDEDNDTLSYFMENNTNASFNFENNIGFINSNYSTEEMVRIVAIDTHSNTTSNYFWISVTNPPPAPTPPPGGGGGSDSSGGGAPTATSGGGGFGGGLPTSSSLEIEEDKIFEERKELEESKSKVSLRVSRSSQDSVSIRVASLEEVSSKLPFMYELLEINATNVLNATIEFSVEKAWLFNNELSYEDISLFRLVGNNWEELETKLLEDSEVSYLFEAYTNNFSFFAIGSNINVEQEELREELPQEITEEVVKKESSLTINLIVIAAIIMLILLVIILVKYFKRNPPKQKENNLSDIDKIIKDIEKL